MAYRFAKNETAQEGIDRIALETPPQLLGVLSIIIAETTGIR